jgi:hypothetical protein
VECKLRCVNFWRVAACRRAFRPALQGTGISDDSYRRDFNRFANTVESGRECWVHLRREQLWHYRNGDMLWPLLRDNDMLLIVRPCHGTLRDDYPELRAFIVRSVTFRLFPRYYGISCVSRNLQTRFLIPIWIPKSWCSHTITICHNYVLY